MDEGPGFGESPGTSPLRYARENMECFVVRRCVYENYSSRRRSCPQEQKHLFKLQNHSPLKQQNVTSRVSWLQNSLSLRANNLPPQKCATALTKTMRNP